MAAISKLPFRITKYLMCMYGGHMCMCVPNIKFLCLTLCQRGGVDIDDADANDTNDDGQLMIVQGSLLDKPNEPKTTQRDRTVKCGAWVISADIEMVC